MSHKSYSWLWLSNNWWVAAQLKRRSKWEFHTTNDNRLAQIAIFQFRSRRETICLFVIFRRVIFTYLTRNSFKVESQEFSCEQKVIELCQSYFVSFCTGRELISLAVLWFMVNLLLETHNECWHCEHLNENVLFLTRAKIRNCRHFFSRFLWFLQSGFQYRNEIMSGQHQQQFFSFFACYLSIKIFQFMLSSFTLFTLCVCALTNQFGLCDWHSGISEKIRYDLRGTVVMNGIEFQVFVSDKLRQKFL